MGLPTFVTIRGSGFLGFDGTAAHVRCRWSRLAPTPPEVRVMVRVRARVSSP